MSENEQKVAIVTGGSHGIVAGYRDRGRAVVTTRSRSSPPTTPPCSPWRETSPSPRPPTGSSPRRWPGSARRHPGEITGEIIHMDGGKIAGH